MNPWVPRAIFSINSFTAAMLTLFLALAMGIANPFWGAMTVYIVSQPQAGSVRSKALYRLLGTLVGGGVAIALVPALYNAPELLSLALACWVGLCLGVSLLDRTPRSYVFMLSGYTAALIAFPGVDHPAAIFDTAIARMEEIALGITCATLMHSIVLPQGVGRTLTLRIDGFVSDARRWMLDALAGEHDPRSSDAHRLAADISELHILATHLPFDTSHFQDRSREVAKLAERMAFVLPLAAAVGDRISALDESGTPLPPATRLLLQDVSGWVDAADMARLDEAPLLAARARAIDAGDGPQPLFGSMTLYSLHLRLADLIEAYRDCMALAHHIRSDAPLPAALQPLLASALEHRLHRDYGMAAWSGATAALAIVVVCAFWIVTGWADGGSAAMLTAIFMCFFAAMDDPAKAIDAFALWWGLSIPITAVYIFAILPMLHGFATLALALAPVLLGLGVLIANPRYTMRALPLAMGIVGSLGIKESFTPDFAQFANASVASIAGLVTASVVTRLVRSVGAEFSARRIVRLSRAELVRAITSRKPVSQAHWTSGMVDRVGLVGARVIAAGDPDDLVPHSLSMMRVGLNLLSLRDLARPNGGTITTLLDAMAVHFRNLKPTDLGLLDHIDHAIADAANWRAPVARKQAMLALIGLRRALFPGSMQLEVPA